MKPVFDITADDKRITDLIRDRLLSLNLTNEDGFESDTLDITLDNRALKIEPPKTGAELKVSLGYLETGVYQMGLFVVDEYERSGMPHKLIIRARSAWGGDGKTISATRSGIETKLKETRTRSWDLKTLGDILGEIAAECGLEPGIDGALAGEEILHIDQTRQSNLQFIQRLAKERDAVFKSSGGKLIFVPKAKGKALSGSAVPDARLTLEAPGSGGVWAKLSGGEDSYRLTVAERENFKRVTAFYHDFAAAELKKVTVGDGSPARELPGNFPTPEEAAQAAAAELRRIGRGKSAPTFNCEGNPQLAAEGKLIIDGTLGSDLMGEWIITRAVHTLDDGGYKTSLECEAPEAKK